MAKTKKQFVTKLKIDPRLQEYLDLVKKGLTTKEACEELGVSKWTVIDWEKKIKYSENEEEREQYRQYLVLYNEAIDGQKEMFYTAIGLYMSEFREQGLHWMEIAAKFGVKKTTITKWRKIPVIAEILELAEPKYISHWLGFFKENMKNFKANHSLVLFAMYKWIGLKEGASLDEDFNVVGGEQRKAVFERIRKMVETEVIERISVEEAKKQIEGRG